jgi:hypothetical protein
MAHSLPSNTPKTLFLVGFGYQVVIGCMATSINWYVIDWAFGKVTD